MNMYESGEGMKEQVLAIIHDLCLKEAYEQTSAMQLSEALRMSRNQCAVMLNQLVKEKKVVKVGANPKLFLSTEVLKEKHGLSCLEDTYPSLAQVFSIKEEHHDFEKLIGYDQSLKETVKQCKATISYPPHGLPMMLYGPTGTGKSYIAKLTYEWAVNHGVIRADAKFITVNCSEYANNPELLTANLFGHVKGAFTGADKDNEGLISLADQGILFLDEVHELKAECQEKLFLVMDQGIYHRVGDNEKWYKSQTRIIFATTENPEHVLLKTLLRRIPMTITVPSLEERGMQERIELIYSMFAQEQKRLSCKIKISSKVYSVLVSAKLSGNIGELKSCIQSCCVNALFEKEKEEMPISLRNLPQKVLNECNEKRLMLEESDEFIYIDSLKNFYHGEQEIIQLNDQLLIQYEAYVKNKLSLEELMKKGKAMIQQSFDRIIYQNKETSQQEYYQRGVQHIFELIESRYGVKISNNDVILIACYLEEVNREYYNFRNWSLRKEEVCEDFLQLIENEYYRPTKIAMDICNYLKSYLDTDMFPIMIITFILYLHDLEKSLSYHRKLGIILAHGFSTASSIADATNRFLGEYVFDAIDMPMNVDTHTVIDKLNQYLKRVGHMEELYLLVDMGSLEEIYKGICLDHANIGVINHVSTPIALEIGNGIKQDQPMEELFQHTIKHMNTSYQILKNRQKEAIILCSCVSGIGTAGKLQEIIEESLPEQVNISVHTCNYTDLIAQGLANTYFQEYRVLCVVGTLNPNLEGLKFIGIEDLIIDSSPEILHEYFKDEMSEAQMEVFMKNLLHHFSLSNIMNNLTILNPSKLLEHVADAIDQLQQLMHVQLHSKTCFGIYVHVCCLIERLVISKGSSEEAIMNVKVQDEFVQYVKTAFAKVEQFYGVDIPLQEIGYIKNYVDHDDSN